MLRKKMLRDIKHNLSQFITIFLMVFIFYLLSFAVLYLFSLGDKIVGLYGEVKNMAMEREVKNSLFKLTHEVKNPIAVCKGYLDMLNVNDCSQVERYIPIVRQELNRSLDIMNDFMEFSKIKIEKDYVDVNMLLEELESDLNLLIKE